jgi:hypothetical protein
MLRKRTNFISKYVDEKAHREHSEEGSKRFEEQQAGGNVADLER